MYERYRQFYVKYGGENVMNIAKEVATEFFDYTVFDSVDMKKLNTECSDFLKLTRKKYVKRNGKKNEGFCRR